MIKRLLTTFLTVLLVFGSVTFPTTITQAQDNPGACIALPGPTVAAPQTTTQAATEIATEAPAPEGGDTGGDAVSGSIALSGAFALYPLAQRWGEEFNKLHPDVQFDIQAGGAGKGMTDVLAGAVNIAMVSREIRPEETDKGAVGYPVAIDAVVFTINAQNPVLSEIQAKGLTCAAIAKLFFSTEQLTWGQVVGTDDQSPVNVYTRADAAGAAEQAARYLGGLVQDDLQGIAVQGDTGVLEAVRQDPYAIGYNNIGFSYDISTGNPIEGVAIVPLDQDGDGTLSVDESIYATLKDITTGIAADKYPSPPARELFFVTKGKPTGAALEFIKWTLTEGQAFVEESGYVKVKPEVIEEALANLE